MKNKTAGSISVCRDVDCPECGWPETYSEVDPASPLAPVLLATGCRKCGWRVAASHSGEER